MFKVTSNVCVGSITTKKGLPNFLKDNMHITHFPCSSQKFGNEVFCKFNGGKEERRVSYIRAFSYPYTKKSSIKDLPSMVAKLQDHFPYSLFRKCYIQIVSYGLYIIGWCSIFLTSHYLLDVWCVFFHQTFGRR